MSDLNVIPMQFKVWLPR